MVDYVYTLREREYPNKSLYATAFEFGTFGETSAAVARTLQTMSLENQLYWYGASSRAIHKRVLGNFRELFYPSEDRWRRKAVADADQALDGILRAQGFYQGA